MMQIQYTKNLNPGRFELGTTLSQQNRSIKLNPVNFKKFTIQKKLCVSIGLITPPNFQLNFQLSTFFPLFS